MTLLLLFSFLAGFVTILAPCIWPILPIVLSSSLAGEKGHRRPLGITLGIMLSFTVFTLSVSYLVRTFHLDPNVLRVMAVVVIVFLGLTMMIPALGARFELLVSRFSSLFGRGQPGTGTGFLPGFITGLSLGLVWAPCAGPILATIAALAATGRVSFTVGLVTLSYITGVGVPLFAFAYGGRRFVSSARWLNQYTERIQRVFGAVVILAALAIYTNYDQALQLRLLEKFPALGQAVNGFEHSRLLKERLDALRGRSGASAEDKEELFNSDAPAPAFAGIAKWLNLQPGRKKLELKDLKGKVVLVDFWTYTCINCIRTLPFTTAWYEKYKDRGFVVVGVHTPEFQFEHDPANVEKALKRYNIHYPVALDNSYATWNSYANEYWPAGYLVDANGKVRRTHFGEGGYEQTEKAIQALLREAGKEVEVELLSMPAGGPAGEISPETYLGARRMQYYFPSGRLPEGSRGFKPAESPDRNSFSLGGNWNITAEYAAAGAGASLAYNFTAGKVFLVLRPGAGGRGAVKVFLDGKPVDAARAGADVKDGVVIVDSDRLYGLIDLRGRTESHVLKLEFQTPGMKAFAFTFG